MRLTNMVDENRIKGAAQSVAATVEDAAGGLTGDVETQAAGKARQAAGEAQNAYGRGADQVRQMSGEVVQAAAEQPLAAFLITFAIGFFLGRMSTASRG
jgi:uncharacterized protein YjbJ (UPF0337 family)